jgi:hypothetical protein
MTWVVRPCTLIGGYQRFREMYNHHLLGKGVEIVVVCSSEMLVTTYKTMKRINEFDRPGVNQDDC